MRRWRMRANWVAGGCCWARMRAMRGRLRSIDATGLRRLGRERSLSACSIAATRSLGGNCDDGPWLAARKPAITGAIRGGTYSMRACSSLCLSVVVGLCGASLALTCASAVAQTAKDEKTKQELIDIERRIGAANLHCDYKYFAMVEAAEFIFTDS